ncbi:MAG: cadherin-like beta sandwich domain-containing protein [Peptococcaceae bacterium]|nr:cadherin-like beta sandwich domain-containing protein [Peptococcaceae bacterium]
MKKAVIRVCAILLLLASFNAASCQAQAGNAVIGSARTAINDSGQVDVNGKISSGPGQQVTIAVIAPDGGIEYTDSVLSTANGEFTFSYPMTNRTPGTYKVRLGGSGVDRPVTATFYSPLALLGVSASVRGNDWVLVSGRITSGAGQQVAINVTAPDGRLDYVDSTLSQAGGGFAFLYPLTRKIKGTYRVKIGAGGIYNPVTVSFPFGCKSDDATLANLKLSAGSLDQAFAPERTGYTATVPVDVNSVAVIPVTSDVQASVKVNGESVASGSKSKGINLAAGAANKINIVATAQDGVTTKTYTVNIARGYKLSDVTAQISQEKQVSVSGRISAGSGQVISVVITDPNGNNDYVNSTLSAGGGDFSFSYPLSNNTGGTYTVKVGGKNVAAPATASFSYTPVIYSGGGGGGGGFVPTSAVAVSSDEIVITFSKAMNDPEDSSVFAAFEATYEGEIAIACGDSHVDGDDPHKIHLLFVGGSMSPGDTISLHYAGTASNPITAADGTPVANFTMPVTNGIPD